MFEVLISALIVTITSSVVLLTWFRHKVLWWEITMLIGISLLVGACFKWVTVSGLTKDTEYWGTRLEQVRYYERWDEYIHQTCSRQYVCGTDSEGNTRYCTEYYDCSYVENHRAYWTKIDHIGNSYDISKEEYLRLKNKMGNSQFKDMKRNYHSVDGDMYYTNWNKKIEDYECITSTHTYENKTQAVPNVFNYVEVDSFDIASYKLFEYPKPSGRSRYYQKNILGYNDKESEHISQILNGELGNKKQVKTFFLVFKNQPMEAADYQESYWKGGNKNEVVVCINLDNENKPTWTKVFSWSEKEDFKINIRNYVLDQEVLDMSKVVRYTHNEIQENFVRKEFSDFDYLEVKLSPSQLFWSIIVSLIVNIGVSIFIILNPFEDEWEERRNNFSYNRRRYY